MDVGLATGLTGAEEIISRCRQLGVRFVTLAVDPMPGYRENFAPDRRFLSELCERLADAEITVSALNNRFGWERPDGPDPSVVEDISRHRREVEGALGTLELQGELGIGAQVHYVGVPMPADPARDELYWSNLTAYYREVVPQAERSGVRIANHGIWRCLPLNLRDKAVAEGVTEHGYRSYRREGWQGPYLVRRADDIARIVQETPSPSNGVTLCTGMYITGSDPVAEVRRFAGKIHFAQVRDLDARWPAARELFPGAGRLDWKAIVGALVEAGFDGFIHPEHLGSPRRPGEDLELEATELVRQWVAEAEAKAGRGDGRSG